jgi:hypothetical protein
VWKWFILMGLLVDLIGIEPMTSSMPWKRAPSCATGPLSGRTLSILADCSAFVNEPRELIGYLLVSKDNRVSEHSARAGAVLLPTEPRRLSICNLFHQIVM